jgi:hypothetical protein
MERNSVADRMKFEQTQKGRQTLFKEHQRRKKLQEARRRHDLAHGTSLQARFSWVHAPHARDGGQPLASLAAAALAPAAGVFVLPGAVVPLPLRCFFTHNTHELMDMYAGNRKPCLMSSMALVGRDMVFLKAAYNALFTIAAAAPRAGSGAAGGGGGDAVVPRIAVRELLRNAGIHYPDLWTQQSAAFAEFWKHVSDTARVTGQPVDTCVTIVANASAGAGTGAGAGAAKALVTVPLLDACYANSWMDAARQYLAAKTFTALQPAQDDQHHRAHRHEWMVVRVMMQYLAARSAGPAEVPRFLLVANLFPMLVHTGVQFLRAGRGMLDTQPGFWSDGALHFTDDMLIWAYDETRRLGIEHAELHAAAFRRKTTVLSPRAALHAWDRVILGKFELCAAVQEVFSTLFQYGCSPSAHDHALRVCDTLFELADVHALRAMPFLLPVPGSIFRPPTSGFVSGWMRALRRKLPLEAAYDAAADDEEAAHASAARVLAQLEQHWPASRLKRVPPSAVEIGLLTEAPAPEEVRAFDAFYAQCLVEAEGTEDNNAVTDEGVVRFVQSTAMHTQDDVMPSIEHLYEIVMKRYASRLLRSPDTLTCMTTDALFVPALDILSAAMTEAGLHSTDHSSTLTVQQAHVLVHYLQHLQVPNVQSRMHFVFSRVLHADRSVLRDGPPMLTRCPYCRNDTWLFRDVDYVWAWSQEDTVYIDSSPAAIAERCAWADLAAVRLSAVAAFAGSDDWMNGKTVAQAIQRVIYLFGTEQEALHELVLHGDSDDYLAACRAPEAAARHAWTTIGHLLNARAVSAQDIVYIVRACQFPLRPTSAFAAGLPRAVGFASTHPIARLWLECHRLYTAVTPRDPSDALQLLGTWSQAFENWPEHNLSALPLSWLRTVAVPEPSCNAVPLRHTAVFASP